MTNQELDQIALKIMYSSAKVFEYEFAKILAKIKGENVSKAEIEQLKTSIINKLIDNLKEHYEVK